MIVAELAGGLGNQLFQYAAARTVADRLGTELGLDIRTCRAADSRAYALGPYAIRAHVVPDDDLRGLRTHRPLRWMLTTGAIERIGTLFRPAALSHFARVIEGRARYARLEHVTDGSWLAGYWQSERHFAAAGDRLRADLAVLALSKEGAALEAHVVGMECPVAVHVRRGDYAMVPSTRAYHGLCSVEYYRAAMDRIRATLPRSRFVFFSEDPDWVTQSLGAEADLIVRLHDGQRPHEDLHLMTRCRAHVISNSTFGWWGAWLAGSPRVIAPARWF